MESHVKSSRWAVSAFTAALAVALVAGLLATACGRGDDRESIEEDLAETGTLDILEQAGEDEYQPPADGELTGDQVEMYLAVQERAAKIRQVTGKRLQEQEAEAKAEEREVGFMEGLSALGQAADFVTADIRAAKELGHNSAEYQWVQEQVMEAQVAKMSRGMQAQMGQAAQQFVEAMEQQLANTEDAEQKAAIEQQIAEYRQGLEESMAEEELEPGVAHNLELLERYQDRLDRIQELYQEMDEQQREEAAR
jgi:hypothetical protein